MNRTDKLWLMITAGVSIILGSALVLNGTAAGWFLIFLGLTYVAASAGIGQKRITSSLNLARKGLIGATGLTVLLMVVGVAGCLL
jgi:hypothetical protein